MENFAKAIGYTVISIVACIIVFNVVYYVIVGLRSTSSAGLVLPIPASSSWSGPTSSNANNLPPNWTMIRR